MTQVTGEFTLWHLLLLVLGSSVLGALVTGVFNRLNAKDTTKVAIDDLELKSKTVNVEAQKVSILDRDAETRAHDAVTKAAEATGDLYNELIDRMEHVTAVVTAKFEECQRENSELRQENREQRARLDRLERALVLAGIDVTVILGETAGD